MARGSHIRRNASLSFASSAVRMGTNMLLFVGIARIYGAESFGQFTTAHVYLTLFLYLADFGIDLLIATEIARDVSRAQSLLNKFFPMKLAAGMAAMVLMGVVAFVSGVSSTTMTLMLILSASLVVTTLGTYYFAVFRGFEKLHHETVVLSQMQGVLLAAFVVLAALRMPVEWIALAFVASRALGLVLIHRRARKRLNVRVDGISLENWSGTVLQGVPWGVHLLFGALYFQLDTLLLAAWAGDHAVGIYQSAMKLAVVVLAIPDVLVSSLLPVFARLHVENKDKWEELGRIASRTMMYLSLPFALIFIVYPNQTLSIVYGAEGFREAVPVLRVLGAVLVVRFSIETFALALTTTRNQLTRMWIAVGVTVLNFALNAYAIPRFGFEGAAYVSLFTNVSAGLCYVVAARGVGFRVSFLVGGRSVLALASVVLLGLVLWSFLGSSLILGIALTVVGCPLLCYGLGYSRDERKTVFAFPARLV